jgi:membrane-associated phospholipid phosphatase
MQKEHALMSHQQIQTKPFLSRLLWLLGVASFLASTFYPSDMTGYATEIGISEAPETAFATDHYGRFFNTALQIGLPLVLRDKAGMIELVKVGIATTLATHALKRAVNNVYIMDTRLGQRPYSPDSKWNMPSGHSSMASSGAYFVSRRYGWKLAFIVLPVLLLTMFARVSLDKHTVSAVISGALLGILVTAIFTTPYRKRTPVDQVS